MTCSQVFFLIFGSFHKRTKDTNAETGETVTLYIFSSTTVVSSLDVKDSEMASEGHLWPADKDHYFLCVFMTTE